ncbi:hypothetical protein AB0L59_35955 [Streptomyces sp. NPDC052109]|uniref:hypothetical protein n=1 Tax=Streptomyces sp. NPDC052109 TaxID=3155527 RepID=UPI00343734A5
MAWDGGLSGLDESELNGVFLHPEHRANLSNVTWLLERYDAAGNSVDGLYDVQAHLFRFSYRAQLAAQSIGRALRRVQRFKAPDWPGAHSAEAAAFVPPWQLSCPSDSSQEEHWRLERQVAERVIRQLRAVGDALAWRVYNYDRRAIVALSRNTSPGPFVGKEGLDYELGKVVEIKDRAGNFALLHDLTSVLRVLDVTELRPDGSRMLQEVKSSTAPSATAKARRQLKQAQQLLAAIDGSQPLPGTEAIQLWRSPTQLRTHVRDLRPLLERAENDGWAAARISDRVIGVLHLLTAARDGHPEAKWAAYISRRDRLLDQHQGGERGLHRLQATSADTSARDPATAPWGIYPLPARHRAALICDYLIIQTFALADGLAERFQRRNLHAQILLPHQNGTFDTSTDVLRIAGPRHGMIVHGNAIYQLLMEFIRTDHFVSGISEALQLPQPPHHTVHTFSNERAAWI